MHLVGFRSRGPRTARRRGRSKAALTKATHCLLTSPLLATAAVAFFKAALLTTYKHMHEHMHTCAHMRTHTNTNTQTRKYKHTNTQSPKDKHKHTVGTGDQIPPSARLVGVQITTHVDGSISQGSLGSFAYHRRRRQRRQLRRGGGAEYPTSRRLPSAAGMCHIPAPSRLPSEHALALPARRHPHGACGRGRPSRSRRASVVELLVEARACPIKRKTQYCGVFRHIDTDGDPPRCGMLLPRNTPQRCYSRGNLVTKGLSFRNQACTDSPRQSSQPVLASPRSVTPAIPSSDFPRNPTLRRRTTSSSRTWSRTCATTSSGSP